MQGHYSDVWQAVARALPERLAIRTIDGREWSYSRFAREAGALAAYLTRHGVERGDRVAMLLYNTPELLVNFFACLATGVTPVPLNYRLRPGEIAALLDDSQSRVLVYPGSLEDVAVAAVAQSDHDVVLVRTDDTDEPDGPGSRWADVVADDVPLPAHAPDGGELWIYTGGTTGRPKAVRWSAPDMFEVQMFATYELGGLPTPTTMDEAVAIASDPDTSPMVNLPLAPLMHGTALTTSMNTLAVGGTVALMCSPRLDAERAVAFANEARATRIIVAGDAVAIPIADAAERLGVRLETVTSVMSSGMRFSAESKRRLHELADLRIYDMLASTEGGGFAVTITTGIDDLPGRPKLFPTAVVFDADFTEIQDQVGALGVLGQRGALPLGYHADAAKTDATFPVINGVRHVVPGDWVRVQEDRYIEFLGRGSGVINTGGEKVYPLEVEEALLAHPGVADAVVIGVPDPRFGEIVTAVVEPADARTTAEELISHVGELLAGYKKPRHILFRASLERTPTGKVDMAALRGEVQQDREEEHA